MEKNNMFAFLRATKPLKRAKFARIAKKRILEEKKTEQKTRSMHDHVVKHEVIHHHPANYDDEKILHDKTEKKIQLIELAKPETIPLSLSIWAVIPLILCALGLWSALCGIVLTWLNFKLLNITQEKALRHVGIGISFIITMALFQHFL